MIDMMFQIHRLPRKRIPIRTASPNRMLAILPDEILQEQLDCDAVGRPCEIQSGDSLLKRLVCDEQEGFQ